MHIHVADLSRYSVSEQVNKSVGFLEKDMPQVRAHNNNIIEYYQGTELEFAAA